MLQSGQGLTTPFSSMGTHFALPQFSQDEAATYWQEEHPCLLQYDPHPLLLLQRTVLGKALRCSGVLNNQLSKGAGYQPALQGGKALICSICQLPCYKSRHPGQFQTSNLTSLKAELRRDAGWSESAQHTIALDVTLCKFPHLHSED